MALSFCFWSGSFPLIKVVSSTAYPKPPRWYATMHQKTERKIYNIKPTSPKPKSTFQSRPLFPLSFSQNHMECINSATHWDLSFPFLTDMNEWIHTETNGRSRARAREAEQVPEQLDSEEESRRATRPPWPAQCSSQGVWYARPFAKPCVSLREGSPWLHAWEARQQAPRSSTQEGHTSLPLSDHGFTLSFCSGFVVYELWSLRLNMGIWPFALLIEVFWVMGIDHIYSLW